MAAICNLFHLWSKLVQNFAVIWGQWGWKWGRRKGSFCSFFVILSRVPLWLPFRKWNRKKRLHSSVTLGQPHLKTVSRSIETRTVIAIKPTGTVIDTTQAYTGRHICRESLLHKAGSQNKTTMTNLPSATMVSSNNVYLCAVIPKIS